MIWALVVAGRGGRRSCAARDVVEALAARGLRVGGFSQRTVDDERGAKLIDLVRARDGATAPLARSVARADPAEGAGCSIAFDPAGFEVARRWLEEDAGSSDVLVLDGIGKLELGGGGHRAAVTRALEAGPPVVLAVRDDQLVYAVEVLGLGEAVAAWAEGDGPEALVAFVDEVVRAARAPRQARS